MTWLAGCTRHPAGAATRPRRREWRSTCVADARLAKEGPFDHVWAQPAAGDAGTALGAALHVAREVEGAVAPMAGAALGRRFDDQEIESALRRAKLSYERPPSVADCAAETLAADGVVAWFQGRSEFGPRRWVIAHCSHILANAQNLERLNEVKGREQFRPVAPMVLAERAPEIFAGVLPSAYMLFTHEVSAGWRDRIPAVVHVDGTARIQTVDRRGEPVLARMLEAFEQ